MLHPNYLSDPLDYDPIDPENTWPQNEWISEPPRLYETAMSRDGEFLAVRVPIVFCVPQPSPNNSAASYWVFCVLQSRNPGGHRQYYQRFDATTGEFMSKILKGDIQHLVTSHIAQGRRGEIWAQNQTGGIRKLLAPAWEFDDSTTFIPDDFSPPAAGPFAIDTAEDIFLCTQSLGQAEGRIYVYRLSTGELIRSVVVGSNIFCILLEDDHRCYAVCNDGQFVLVDYVAGRALGALRLQLLGGQDISDKAFQWDPFARRILTVERELDDATTGACNTIIRGYYPIPGATKIAAPIPLTVPRAGRRIRVASRLIGDGGEGIAGRRVTATTTGDATLPVTRTASDAYGYALFDLVCDDDGTADVTVAHDTE